MLFDFTLYCWATEITVVMQTGSKSKWIGEPDYVEVTPAKIYFEKSKRSKYDKDDFCKFKADNHSLVEIFTFSDLRPHGYSLFPCSGEIVYFLFEA